MMKYVLYNALIEQLSKDIRFNVMKVLSNLLDTLTKAE